MRVLAAFDKFKDSISAPMACDIAAGAIASLHRGWDVDACPLADGGDGFAGILTRAAGGSETAFAVSGPRGDEVMAAVGVVSINKIPAAARSMMGLGGPDDGGCVAVIEMAAASGLARLETGRRNPLLTSSLGTGQLIHEAAAAGVRAIILGVGGSATSDLGLGALGALGIDCTGASGESIDRAVPSDWPRVRAIRGQVPGSLPPVLIACDVDNPLLGPRGTVSVYGAQKGLAPGDSAALEAESSRIAGLMCSHFGQPQSVAAVPGAGAAGGIAFGLMVAAKAVLLPGFELVAAWLDIDRRISAADAILTGEGRFDDSSLSGKGPGAVVLRGLALGKQVHVFAGRVEISRTIPGLIPHSITPGGVSLADALAEAPSRLFASVRDALGRG